MWLERERDVKLLAVTAPRRIVIRPYNVRWPGEFARVEAALRGWVTNCGVAAVAQLSEPGIAPSAQ